MMLICNGKLTSTNAKLREEKHTIPVLLCTFYSYNVQLCSCISHCRMYTPANWHSNTKGLFASTVIAILVYHNAMYPNPVGIVCVQQIEIHVFCKQVGHPHP